MDTGDLLSSRAPAPNTNQKKIGELKSELYMKTYNFMGYDAFTPGEIDLAFGLDHLVKMSKQANFPFLAANLMSAKTRNPLFKSHTIKEFQGVKIGLFGLISPRFPAGGSLEESKEYYLADPVEVAQKTIAELKKKHCRVIVVLAHMETHEQEMLAKNIPSIQFILSGHITRLQLEPIESNDTQIFMAGSRGENLGQVDFFIEEKTLYSRYDLVPLTAKFADHPKVQEWLNQYKIDLQKLLQTPPPTTPRKSPAITRRQVAIPVTPLFMGEKYCLSCHPQQHQSWMNTSHARAYQTLSPKNKSSDPTCLACHTTGLGIVRNPKAFFENVQCEACHGPAEGHPDMRRSLSQIGEDQCRKCHNAGNSPNFHYPTYLQKIRHQK
ncbi:MAG: hypothetical protein FJ117_01205 [Deltaproteobacteria bacterium]|nr:hypothetical protein [Deltaproteobacteria bacterium]